MYFHFEWGCESTTLTLFKDFFKISKATIRRILRPKLNVVLEARHLLCLLCWKCRERSRVLAALWLDGSIWELWAGAISDTEYQTRSGVFEYMQWFVDHFDKGVPFANIVDKWYRCIMAAWRVGKRLFLQPAFARSDRKFNTREVNRSSTVASDRSGLRNTITLGPRPPCETQKQ